MDLKEHRCTLLTPEQLVNFKASMERAEIEIQIGLSSMQATFADKPEPCACAHAAIVDSWIYNDSQLPPEIQERDRIFQYILLYALLRRLWKYEKASLAKN